MSYARKVCHGPALSAACAHCDKRVSVAWLSMGAVVPLIVCCRLGLYVGYSWRSMLVLLVGLAAMLAIYAFVMALVARGR